MHVFDAKSPAPGYSDTPTPSRRIYTVPKLLYHEDEQSRSVAAASNLEILITGGHGGVVTYDGSGGAMEKRGGPIDRAFLLTKDGRLLGDAALDIDYGCINFRTGELDGRVRVLDRQTQDARVRYEFKANEADNGIEITGGIQRLNIPRHTVLVSGDVAASAMEYRPGDTSDVDSRLPYVTYHSNVVVDQRILTWFEIPSAIVIAGASGWDKITPSVIDDLASIADYGVSFETQQHIGFTRVFLKYD